MNRTESYLSKFNQQNVFSRISTLPVVVRSGKQSASKRGSERKTKSQFVVGESLVGGGDSI